MTPPAPRFSVIVPVYNVESYVEECLESILRQSDVGLEVVVIDDRGDDQSMSIVSDVAARDTRIRVISHDRNLGLGDARNSGWRAARGEYVVFVDSDDSLYPGTLAAVEERARLSDAEVVIFDHERTFAARKPRPSKNRRRFARAPQVFTAASFLPLLDALPIAPAKAYRRELLARVNLDFPGGLYEDIPWTLPVLCAAKSISYVPHVGYNYRQRADSILNTSSTRHFEVHAQYRLLFARLGGLAQPSAIARIYANMSTHLWLVVSPVRGRISDADRGDFLRASRATLWSTKPSLTAWAGGLRRPRHFALATGSVIVYRSVRGLIKWNRKRLKKRRAAAAAPR